MRRAPEGRTAQRVVAFALSTPLLVLPRPAFTG